MREEKFLKLVEELKKVLTDEEKIQLIEELELKKLLKEAMQVASGNYQDNQNSCPCCNRPY